MGTQAEYEAPPGFGDPNQNNYSLNFNIEDKGNYYVAIYSHRDYVYCQEFLNDKEYFHRRSDL